MQRKKNYLVYNTSFLLKLAVNNHDIELSKKTQWTVLGTLSTLSHGLWLFISVPIWLITGLMDGRKNSRSAILVYPDVPLSDFSMFARFPQGIPATLDRSTLRPSNYH